MKEFKDRVALITGTAHGFGAEFVKEAVRRGMKVVSVDIEEEPMRQLGDELRAQGADITDIVCDVTKYDQVEAVVQKAMETYGQIDLLMCNAGITVPRYLWEVPIRDWEWAMDVNVMQHVYFMKLVIPIMVKQGTECHICNTCSIAGLTTLNGMPVYHASKHAAVALAECVQYDVEAIGANIHVSVFCPGLIHTDLHNCEKHRPPEYKDDSDPYYSSKEYIAGQKVAAHLTVNGKRVDFVAPRVFQAIEDNDFYILTDPQYTGMIERRMHNMLDNKPLKLKDLTWR